jgi:deazaflavin-dependent oxidoreductase (nitroreductase family)
MSLQQRLRKGLLIGLKYTLNPLTRRLARSSFGPISIIRHVGRRSGKVYETPIMAIRIEDGFMIELTYGYEVDWYKNVVAAGGCTVVWHGEEYVINKIEPIDTETGRAAFPLPAQLILRILRRKDFEKMKVQQLDPMNNAERSKP